MPLVPGPVRLRDCGRTEARTSGPGPSRCRAAPAAPHTPAVRRPPPAQPSRAGDGAADQAGGPAGNRGRTPWRTEARTAPPPRRPSSTPHAGPPPRRWRAPVVLRRPRDPPGRAGRAPRAQGRTAPTGPGPGRVRPRHRSAGTGAVPRPAGAAAAIGPVAATPTAQGKARLQCATQHPLPDERIARVDPGSTDGPAGSGTPSPAANDLRRPSGRDRWASEWAVSTRRLRPREGGSTR